MPNPKFTANSVLISASDERGPSGPSRSSSVVQCSNFSFSNQLITIYILTFGDIIIIKSEKCITLTGNYAELNTTTSCFRKAN